MESSVKTVPEILAVAGNAGEERSVKTKRSTKNLERTSRGRMKTMVHGMQFVVCSR